jgi:hypothetical protein
MMIASCLCAPVRFSMSQEDEGQTEPFDMRVHPSWMRRIDDRHRKQDDLPSRADAIRRLVELGLRIRVSGR